MILLVSRLNCESCRMLTELQNWIKLLWSQNSVTGRKVLDIVPHSSFWSIYLTADLQNCLLNTTVIYYFIICISTKCPSHHSFVIRQIASCFPLFINVVYHIACGDYIYIYIYIYFLFVAGMGCGDILWFDSLLRETWMWTICDPWLCGICAGFQFRCTPNSFAWG